MKTLVVEDDSVSRLFLEEVLRSLGHDVCSFENAEDALASCQQESFELAILDWILPGMAGLTLCRKIRTLPWGEQILILITTASDQEEDLMGTVLVAGADDFLEKPINPDLVRIRLTQHQLIRAHRQDRGRTRLRRVTGDRTSPS